MNAVSFSFQATPSGLLLSVEGAPRLLFEDLGNQIGATYLRDARGVARLEFSNTDDGYGVTALAGADGVRRFEATSETGPDGGTKIRDEEGNLFQFVRGVTVQKTFTVSTLPNPAETSLPAGARAVVTDAANPYFGKPAVGGGTTTSPVYCDGTIWRLG